MPFAPVNDDGAKMEYEDSGAPADSTTYATVLVLHGGYFNNGIFRRLIPFAAASSLRLVLLNARDVGQSTPYTELELSLLQSNDKAKQEAFFRKCVPEYAAFVAWYVQHEEIPLLKVEECGLRTGGISLVGWSAANDWFIPFFAMPEELPERVRVAIEPYLRSWVMYDSTYYAIGKPDPPNDLVYCPLRDTEMTQAEQAEAFPAWVSGYYFNHKPIVRAAFEATSLAAFPSIAAFCTGIDIERDANEVKRAPTLYTIPKETLAEITSPDAFVRSILPVLFFDKTLYAEYIRRVIFDEDLAKRYFPRVDVRVVSCMQGQGDCLYCTYALKEMLLKRKEKGRGGRKMDIVPVDGFNHMAHWDEPEKMVKLFASII
ncbi:hypothetical protein EUX98_g4744 [Antrodiella citrinella]|uniref:AB hydrolase-1 domain-containing protein n=1 Tax=Antrodiella citrinella TaxID=2447956 RepID=A0A4S4MTB1_9APHY|nr:hypothetical protein EUX98_g4744 [Antrodiella citrinella]